MLAPIHMKILFYLPLFAQKYNLCPYLALITYIYHYLPIFGQI